MRSIPILDLKAQLASYRERALQAMTEVMDSQYFILGPKVAAFESALGEWLALPPVIGVSSGTDALLVALMALDIGPGDEVIIPAKSFFATAGVVARLGATPVFVDVDPETFNVTEAMVKPAITERTKAIIPVHLFGQCADLGELYDTPRDQRPAIIEDAAQALGAQLRGKHTGHLGDLCCTSFFPSKNLGGFGDGGAVYGSDETLLEKMRILRVHGSKPKYHHHLVGGNFRLDALQAVILHIKLEFLNQWAEHRRRNAQRYNQAFTQLDLVAKDKLITPFARNHDEHVYNQYVIRTPHRDALKEFLKERGVGTMIYYPSPLHTQPCFQELNHKVGDFPVAELACKEVLALPVYPELSDDDFNYVVDSVAAFFKTQV
ncbi:MAG: transcriptional regulator [Myxococcales bacterium]|nr:transcriptional regulator [Myxococcales bacterium]